jgi:hypothetical protein
MRRLTFFVLAIVFSLMANTGQAKILRIGYWGNPISGVDYSTADLAVTAATGGTATTSGDTIMVYGQSGSNAWVFNNLNKKIVIIGSGYFHYASTAWTNFNANLQNYQPSSIIYLDFEAGSDGTQVYGCLMTNNFSSYSVYVNANGNNGVNNIKFSNCFFSGYVLFSSGTFDNWEFSKCYFQTYIDADNSNVKLTNFKLFNSIFFSTSSGLLVSLNSGQFGIIENCSFIAGRLLLNSQGFIIQNCIFSHSYSNTNYSASTFNNCVFDNAPNPAVSGTGNVLSVNNANIYLAHPTQGIFSNDERFKLKVGSPAIGVGIAGVDCGAFGGVNPYKLSGIPAIPAIYKLTAPGSSANSNPYTITFSIRSNN